MVWTNENSRTQVRQFIQGALGKIAREANCGVLLCAHPSANGLSNGSGNGGSTAWHNTVRSRLYLSSNEEGIRTLSRKKANYCSVGEEIKLKWHCGAFEVVPLAINLAKNEKQIITDLIISEAAHEQFYSARKFSDYFENKNGLRSSKTIRRQINQLTEEGIITLNKVDNLFNSQGVLTVNQEGEKE